MSAVKSGSINLLLQNHPFGSANKWHHLRRHHHHTASAHATRLDSKTHHDAGSSFYSQFPYKLHEDNLWNDVNFNRVSKSSLSFAILGCEKKKRDRERERDGK